MHRLPTFRKGGIHPGDKKELSQSQPVERLPFPDELIVPLSQHLGAPANPLKEKGDAVGMGEMIGEASSFISANIHSPVNGTITEIRQITLMNSVSCKAFVIKVDTENPAVEFTAHPWKDKSGEQLLGKVKELGIVGTGGATFPTHVKLSVPKGKSVESLVINGVECEPYLTSDHRLMLEQTEQVLEGIMIAAHITEPKNIIVGVENNKKDAIERLRSVISEKKLPIEVVALQVKYPQGDEKQLLKATINREIPSGKLPLDVGAVVLNVGTAFAVYEAVVYNKPIIDRIVTVSGEAMKEKKNVRTPIGTKIADLIAFSGGLNDNVGKMVAGGPMMGFAFYDDQIPVIKGTSGILALERKKEKKVKISTPCISCGKCVAVCPMGLQPTRLFRLIENRQYEQAMKLNLMDCKECGCCAYSCPSELPLVHGMKLGKKMGRK
ncbi:MAG: electron transport complex subunit RsxC [Sphaerochaetaceae bacterium]|nr:electron transport complex subunit RsxC [Sphaerochaetaceae bacterium]